MVEDPIVLLSGYAELFEKRGDHNAASDFRRAVIEFERLKALLTEAADALAQDAHDQHPSRDKYPDEMRRYERDMELANRIREQTP